MNASDIVNNLSESVYELCNSERNSTQRYTVQQINDTAEIALAEIFGNCFAKITECLQKTADNFDSGFPDSFKKPQKLAFCKNITDGRDCRGYNRYHFAGRFTDL